MINFIPVHVLRSMCLKFLLWLTCRLFNKDIQIPLSQSISFKTILHLGDPNCFSTPCSIFRQHQDATWCTSEISQGTKVRSSEERGENKEQNCRGYIRVKIPQLTKGNRSLAANNKEKIRAESFPILRRWLSPVIDSDEDWLCSVKV